MIASSVVHPVSSPEARSSRPSTLRLVGRLLRNPDSAIAATAWFVAATVAMTWPLSLGLVRDIPWDLGDSLLNCWILGWGADHILRFLSGDLTALSGFWHANIFYPAPLALAYSEHLVAQVIQILPVYAATGNVILCYNLLFLSTFVLSALGTYLFVRDLTGCGWAAVLAGLIFGFALYRVAQFSHLQVLCSQWMPFVFLGLRRHFESDRILPLAGAALALVTQNLSCGYYLVYFAPFLTAYVVYELWDRRRLTDIRLWGRLLVGAAVVACATWPFLQPYLALREGGFAPRSLGEVALYSADVKSYGSTSTALRLWGSLVQAYPKPEGELFPGFVPVLFFAIGFGWHLRVQWRRARDRQLSHARLRWLVLAALLALAVYLVSALTILMGFGFVVSAGSLVLRVTSLKRSLGTAALATLLLCALSARARAMLRGCFSGAPGFFTAALVMAFALSLGPSVQTGGVRLEDGWYLFLYNHVPGFDGVRVPARMGMLVDLFLAVLAGLGAVQLCRGWRVGPTLVWAACLVFLIEATAAPIAINSKASTNATVPPARYVATPAHAPPVYRFLRTLPSDAVVVEFPFGETAYDLRYVYYSTMHWRRLVNGYSGGFPPWYPKLIGDLSVPFADPERAWQRLVSFRVSHIVVHESAYYRNEGELVTAWALSRGAIPVAAFGSDKVFALKPAAR